MPDKLFVYGTLKPGESMGHLLDSMNGRWMKGTVEGKYKEPGSIPGFNYPGVELSDDGKQVDGYLFISDDLKHNWDQIDRYEGKHYRRVITKVSLVDGKMVEAYIYELITDDLIK